MKKFIAIVGLLIVGLMVLGGCSTKEDKSFSEEDNNILTEYSQMYSYGCVLKDNSVFVTIKNHNTTQQLVRVNGENYNEYIIAPLSEKIIEIPIPNDFRYEVEYVGDKLVGKGDLADIRIYEVEYTQKLNAEGEPIQSCTEFIRLDSWFDNNIEDTLTLSCDFQIDESGNINPQNLTLTAKNNAVKESVGEYFPATRFKVIYSTRGSVLEITEEVLSQGGFVEVLKKGSK